MPKDYRLELIKARVSPADRPWEDGIVVEGGQAKSFVVERSWSGPAGHYQEHWTIRRKDGSIVLNGQRRTIFVRGMQAVTAYSDQVVVPGSLEPGGYELVFTIEGRFMGAKEVVVRQATAA